MVVRKVITTRRRFIIGRVFVPGFGEAQIIVRVILYDFGFDLERVGFIVDGAEAIAEVDLTSIVQVGSPYDANMGFSAIVKYMWTDTEDPQAREKLEKLARVLVGRKIVVVFRRREKDGKTHIHMHKFKVVMPSRLDLEKRRRGESDEL